VSYFKGGEMIDHLKQKNMEKIMLNLPEFVEITKQIDGSKRSDVLETVPLNGKTVYQRRG
jgi:hypothetical protein